MKDINKKCYLKRLPFRFLQLPLFVLTPTAVIEHKTENQQCNHERNNNFYLEHCEIKPETYGKKVSLKVV